MTPPPPYGARVKRGPCKCTEEIPCIENIPSKDVLGTKRRPLVGEAQAERTFAQR